MVLDVPVFKRFRSISFMFGSFSHMQVAFGSAKTEAPLVN